MTYSSSTAFLITMVVLTSGLRCRSPETEVEFSMQLCTLSLATGQLTIVVQTHSSK